MKLKMLLGMLVASILSVQSVHPCQEVSLKESMALTSTKLSDEALGGYDTLSNRNYEVLINETGKINKKAIFAPARLGDISVHHDDSEFRIETESGSRSIQSYFVDKELRGVSKENLAKLIAAGSYLSVHKMEGEDEYAIRLNHRLNGGGPTAAYAAYWITKSLCWAGVGAAATAATTGVIAATVATGGAALGASAGVISATSAAATTGASFAVGSLGAGAAGAMGASMGAAAIGTSAAATTAATTTLAAAGSAGGVAGIAGGIECFSVAVAALFGALPTP